MPSFTTTEVTNTVKDAAYVVVGLGVIAFQRSQVRRQELLKALDGQTSDVRVQLTKLAKDLDERFQPVRETIEERLDEIETRLPEQAKDLVQQARKVAKDAEAQVRSRLETAAA